MPLHEWKYEGGFPPQSSIDENGEITETKKPIENLITWVFEDGSFVPCAKIDNENHYSIVADYLGTPTHAYNNAGEKVWEREIDCYGKVRRLNGEKTFCPYLYQGQSVDEETGLAYNRFRYYDNESGNYLSQDPVRLKGGISLYSYVSNTNDSVDIFGLNELLDLAKEAHSNLDKFAQKRRVTAVGKNANGDIFVSSSTPTVSYRLHEPHHFILNNAS